jgi:hypothetical protein
MGGRVHHHDRDGKVVEFWNAAADPYACDELIG